MNMKLPICCLAVAVLFSGAVSSAPAQNALGDGRSLDNNLQAGSGGRNSPLIQNSAGRYANALVTGNVSGLGAFHGKVNYGSDYGFRGSLPSDNLYNFQRIAGVGNPAYAAPGSTGMLNAVTNPLYGSRDIVLRNSTGPTVGTITGQYSPYGPAYSVAGSSPYTAGGGRSALTLDQAQAYSSQPLAVGTDANGQPMSLNASPLTGLTIERPAMESAQPSAASRTSSTAASTNSVAPSAAATTAPASADNDSTAERPSTAPIQLIVGERLGEQMTQSPTQAANPAGTRLAADFDQSLNKLLGSATAKPGEDVYLDLLKRIQPAQPPAPGAPGTPPDQLVPPPTDQPAAQPNPLPYTQPTPPAAAEKTDNNASAQPTDKDKTDKKSAPGTKTDIAKSDKPIDRVLKRLDYDLPPLTSLAGTSQTLFNDAMAEAERHMRDERYFDAQTAYQRAIMLRPDQPLAYVGLANSDLGAGLFLSAGRTLRALFDAHPELIAARYAEPLLPPEKRIADLNTKLQRYLKADTHGTEGLLDLAYLAYQQRDENAMRDAFDLWAKRDPNDPLLPLLRRIWLSSNSALPTSGE